MSGGALLLTTYFNSTHDPLYGRRVASDDILYIAPWYRSVHVQGLRGVVFHDGLSPEFVERFATKNVQFERVDPAPFAAWSLNDRRYFIYEDYLRERPAVRQVFMTDARDVIVAADPFPYLEPGWIYAGSQPGTLGVYSPGCNSYRYIRERLSVAGPRYVGLLDELARERAETGRAPSDYPAFNAGVLGGDREVVMEALAAMRAHLRQVDRPEQDLNMAIFNYTLYTRFRDRVVTGAPVHSLFGGFELYRNDAWFLHK